MTIAQGRRKLEQHLAAMLDAGADTAISPRMRRLIEDMRTEWVELDQRITALDNEFAARARSDTAARRLATIPGIGVLNAMALVAAIGNGETFARGRDLAAWLGLVPRQVTTGGKPRLGGISKRGNKFLRKLLIHGARSVLPVLAASTTSLGDWLQRLLKRMDKNVAVVALANKWRASSGSCCGESGPSALDREVPRSGPTIENVHWKLPTTPTLRRSCRRERCDMCRFRQVGEAVLQFCWRVGRQKGTFSAASPSSAAGATSGRCASWTWADLAP